MVKSRFGILAGLSFGFALAAASSAMAQSKEFRLCTGSETGNYFKAGHMVKKVSSSVKVNVVPTQGSLDNLARITRGECDGAFVQSDALLVYSNTNAAAISSIERAGVLYEEHAHLLCNRKSGVDRVTDLTNKHTVAVGPDGSGARTTWDAFVLADAKRYKPVRIDARSGPRAFAAVADGTDVTCTLWVGALGAATMKGDASARGDQLVLAATDDWDMGKVAKDQKGQPVYGYSEIPAGTYPKIQPGGTLYGTKPVKTITVSALFVSNVNWINQNESDYDRVLRAFSSAQPAIKDMITPK